ERAEVEVVSEELSAILTVAGQFQVDVGNDIAQLRFKEALCDEVVIKTGDIPLIGYFAKAIEDGRKFEEFLAAQIGDEFFKITPGSDQLRQIEVEKRLFNFRQPLN